MSERHLPKGVSLETLWDILAGWAAVGSAVEPRHTSDVAEETGISDAVGRQTRFLEDIGVLDPRDEQKHALTDRGADLARALAADEDERARRVARDLLVDWPVTEDVRGIVRDNPSPEEKLVPLIAALTGHDPESSRVRSGVSTLLELLDWAELLDRDEQGRYRLPREDEDEGDDEPEPELVDVVEEIDESESESELESESEQSSTERESVVERVEDTAAQAEVEGPDESVARQTAARTAREVARQVAEEAARDAVAEMTHEETRSAGAATETTEAGADVTEAEDGAAPATDPHPESESREVLSDTPSEDVEEIEVALGDDAGVQIRIDGDVGLENVDLPEDIHIETAGEQAGGAPSGAENLEPDGGFERFAADGGSVELSEDDGAIHIDVTGEPNITLSLSGEQESEAAPAETEGEAAEAEQTEEVNTAEESPESESEAGGEAESEGEAEDADEETGTEGDESEAETEAAGEAEATEDGTTTAGTTADTDEERAEAESNGALGTEDVEALLENATEGSLEEVLQQAVDTSGDVEMAVGDGAASGDEAAEGETDRPETSRPGEDAIALSLDLSLDADPSDIESLVRGIRRGLTEQGDAER